MERKKKILSTALLPENAIQRFQEEGFELIQHSFISTQSVCSAAHQSLIEEWATTTKLVLFTSANAVNAVVEQLGNRKPDWHFYCVSGKTKDTIESYWGSDKILGSGVDAIAILKEMASIAAQEIIFFCGSKRLDTLPNRLASRGFEVKELMVYQTELTPIKYDENFDAILFFSPSGIESFLMKNTIPPAATLFAIGNTTAKCLADNAPNQIIISPSPDKNIIVNKVIQFYKNKEYNVEK